MDKYKAYDILWNEIEQEASEVDIKWTIENDGIGAYEYWGYKGYDEGTNYLMIEEPSKFIIENIHWSKRFLKKIIKDILEENDSVYGTIYTGDDQYSVKVKGEIDDIKIDGDNINVTIIWDDEEVL